MDNVKQFGSSDLFWHQTRMKQQTKPLPSVIALIQNINMYITDTVKAKFIIYYVTPT